MNMKKIGEGTYGVVYKADFPSHPDPSLRRVALKRIRLDAYDFCFLSKYKNWLLLHVFIKILPFINLLLIYQSFRDSEGIPSTTVREISFLRTLNHVHVVRFDKFIQHRFVSRFQNGNKYTYLGSWMCWRVMWVLELAVEAAAELPLRDVCTRVLAERMTSTRKTSFLIVGAAVDV